MTDLTPRQKGVARRVRKGMTNQQIAGKLGITQRTVEAHRFAIRQRGFSPPLEHAPPQRARKTLSKEVEKLATRVARVQRADWCCPFAPGGAARLSAVLRLRA